MEEERTQAMMIMKLKQPTFAFNFPFLSWNLLCCLVFGWTWFGAWFRLMNQDIYFVLMNAMNVIRMFYGYLGARVNVVHSVVSYFSVWLVNGSPNNMRSWAILCWNIRGINSDEKWDAIRSKVMESKCDIICLQETKREFFDSQYIRKFCPPFFDAFDFLPSIGASGGCIILWNSSKFSGSPVFQNDFAHSVELTSKLLGDIWLLTNVYAPCTPEGKLAFLDWFKHIQTPEDTKWLIVGDFNPIRRPENRNKPGANIQEMLGFNEAISRL